MACHLGLAGATARATRLPVIASASAAGEPARRIIRRRGPPGQQGSAPGPPAQPSVAEVRRALGVEVTASAASSRAEKNSAFMELIASTPIGQPESEAERRLREAAEWVVDTTETRACEGQKSFLVLCMMTFPAWFLLMLIALGVIKLPFDVPGLDNLLIFHQVLMYLENENSMLRYCEIFSNVLEQQILGALKDIRWNMRLKRRAKKTLCNLTLWINQD